MHVKIIIPPDAVSFREVAEKIASALKTIRPKINVEVGSISLMIPNIKFSSHMEFVTYDITIFPMTIAPYATTYFLHISQPIYTKKAWFYGVVEGKPVITETQKSYINGKIVVPSKFCKDMLEEMNIKVVDIIPHGIDPEEWKVNQKEIESWRSQFKDKTIIYYLANWTQRKGIPQLIQALKIVKDKLNQKWIAIIDTGPAGLTNQYKQIVKQLDLEKHVQINDVFGKMTRKEIAIKMTGCDIFTFASMAEGFGIPLLESMTCGKAPVYVNAPPMNEICDPNCGFPVPYQKIEWFNYYNLMIFKNHVYTPEDYAEAIIYAIEHPKEREEKGIKAREKAINQFHYIKTYKRFLEL